MVRPLAPGRRHDAAPGLIREPRLYADGAGIALQEGAVHAGEVVGGAGGVDEVVAVLDDDAGELGDVQEVAPGDGQVAGADEVAAVEPLGPVQAGRVMEDRCIGHPDLLGRSFHYGGEGGQGTAYALGQRVGGVICRQDQKRLEHVVQGPGHALFDADSFG